MDTLEDIKHNLRHARFKGIKKKQDFLYLLFSYMNLKKLVGKVCASRFLKGFSASLNSAKQQEMFEPN